MRGATQLLGAADTTIAIAKKRGIVTAQVRKSNDLSPSDKPVRRFTIEPVSFGKNDEGIETTAPVLVPAKAEHKKPDKPAAASQSRTHSKAAETLRAAMVANDNKPVTEMQWRTASDSTAGNISPAGKRSASIAPRQSSRPVWL